MDQKLILFLIVVSWGLLMVVNYSWIGALAKKRGMFRKDVNSSKVDMTDDGTMTLVFSGPIGFVVLFLITIVPPSSKWIKSQIEKMV